MSPAEYDWADFNPRSREGSDGFLPLSLLSHCISIHAPARGATSVNFLSFIRVEFQSTLPRGERLFDCRTFDWSNRYFNPRSREGSDHHLRHTVVDCAYFNPRSREGSDMVGGAGFSSIASFQSTLPRGERPSSSTRISQSTHISIHAPARGATTAT